MARCDEQLGTLLEATAEAGIREGTLVFVVSDHGGETLDNNMHGDAENPNYSQPLTTTVPWICSGPGIKRGHELQAEVSICDTAATAAYTLGLEIPTA